MKMSVQQFCLRWNNHQPNFISVFSTLLHNEALVDVTLAAEGRQLQAHKVVLSACSSYFQSLFTSNPCQHPIVILKDVQYNDLKTMVDFMYYGEVNVSQEQLPHILKTAEMLKIKGLAEMPDATSLTKSESKSLSEHPDQIPLSSGGGAGGSGSGGGNESLWGSTESQQQFHHQPQQRRTPSPATLSPSARRKRLRKSSTDNYFTAGSGSGSTERTSEEQSSIDGASNINMAQIDPMSSFGGNPGNITPNINNSRILKESSSTETEVPPHESSQESVEEQMHHAGPSVMKPDEDMGNVSQSMPLDITGSGTSGAHTPTVSCSQSQADKNVIMGSKRGRFLIRQPRIKKESELTDHSIHEVDEHHHHHHQHQIYTGLLSVPPPKIERHASEPSPSHSQKHNLLTVPSSFLVKQHSHPLLPSQSHSPPITTLTLQRQLSHPIPQTATTMTSATLTTQLSMDSNLQFVSSTIKTEDLMPISKASSPTVVIVTDPMSQIGELPTLRVKTDELHRSISTPQSLTRELSTESTRSSHCPLVRPGPALGCNFCWNTIDAHGRILRRKTKYHCPECQTNLCIVPCFQEFHERQSSDSSSTGTGGGGGVGSGGAAQNENNKQLSTPSLRHYPKTGSL